MSLHRENILTLIGGRRYHSCILTTFSFDFYFFEMKVMKWLRSCGVRNINVFIDGHYYSELMKQSTGEEMKLTPGYSLYPFFQQSIFHPKIWMLFGENEGLFIVGSGNLTNSGNGNNDEIWAAFHFDIRFPENSQVFSNAWNFISTLTSKTLGQTNEKTTRWIIEHAKWLNELPNISLQQFCKTAQKEEISFLYNSDETSIWSGLSEHLQNQNVIEITTISPFYDIKGSAINELSLLFPNAKINIVLDESGLIPASMDLKKNFTVYDWYDVGVSRTQYSRSENFKSKLHGKIIHFKVEDGKEFCLLGSANVTPEGLGLAGTSKSNTEVSLLIKAEEGQLLAELGIKLSTAKRKRLTDFSLKSNSPIYDTIIKNNKFLVQLLSAEYLYHELILFSAGSISGELQVIFFDGSNKNVHQEIIPTYDHEIKLKLASEISGYQYVQLADTDGNFISNKLIISDYYLLAKTHPNPQTEEIERLYSEIQNGELSKVLELLHFAIIDESEKDDNVINVQVTTSNAKEREESKEPEQLYDLSTYKPILHANFEKSLLLTSPSLRILDVLKFIQNRGITSANQNDIRDDEQETDIGNINGNEENEIKVVHYQSHYILASERRKLLNYLTNLSNYQHNILYGKSGISVYKLTLTDLTRYLIFLELMLEYGGKIEKYIEHNQQFFFSYLPFINNLNNDNVKGCCLNIIGEFLLLAQAGFKLYEFEYTKMKVEQLRHDALINSLVCLLNNNWHEKELHYFYSLLLNTMHYLGWKDTVADKNICNEFKSEVKNRITELKQRAVGLNENIDRFFRIIIPAFQKGIVQLNDKEFDTYAGIGNIIYKSPWGYCYVKSVASSKKYTLVRPGFIWDEEHQDYIKFRPTEIYVPIEISSLIRLDL